MNIKLLPALRSRSLLALCIGATLAHTQAASAQQTTTGEELEEVIVTGYRQSLQNSTDAKRESVGFTDSIFAEDIGKFPDTNIAESFQRIPGVQISREISGEGTQVAIRGLNTNFTKVLLNNAPVAVAASAQEGPTANREVPLDLFPPELFSSLSVAKTSSAEMVEGGAAGSINMRMARPFDTEGAHLTYSIQGSDNSNADDMGTRGALIASNTWGPFGALFGVTAVRDRVAVEGFESVGWASMNLSAAQCGSAPCNTTGGNGPGTPGTVPNNASTIGAGLNPGDAITNAWLLEHNPGRTIQQIDNAVIPRLGRPMFETGDKERYNGIVSLEFRPSDDLRFFLDSMYGKQEHDFDRVDIMWAVRAGSQGGRIIPTQLQVDREDCSRGCVATSGVFPNSQFFLEYRPYVEETEFWGTNPGMNWQITDTLNLDVQGNLTRSEYTRESPTVGLITGATTVAYTNNGGIPQLSSSLDINNPANFHWLATDRAGTDVGRVNVPVEDRETETTGGRFALTWGEDRLNLKVGGAYDEISRDIRPSGNDSNWQAATCGGNPSNIQLGPNSQPPCRGETAAQINASAAGTYPAYAGPYNGSLIPDAALPSYLRPTQHGFVTVNWDDFARDSNFEGFQAASLAAGGLPTTATWGTIEEEITALFAQLSGDAEIGDNQLRYNIGVRWVQTDQSVVSRITSPDPRNPVSGDPPTLTAASDGSRFPDIARIEQRDTKYENWLPSANVAWNVTDAFVLRAGLSRTMTRPNAGDLRSGITVPNADASSASLGNPELDPYLSDNIDLGFEYYTGAEGYFGVAAFRKGIDGFTTLRQTFVPFSSLAQYGLTLQSLGAQQQQALQNRATNLGVAVTDVPVRLDETINADGRLTINGLEFNWVQPLDFLLGGIGMQGFGFTANYTIIDQKGEGAAPAIAINVPPESYNATFYYENFGVSARISVTHSQGSQITGPNSNQMSVVGAELFVDDFTQWDFSSSFDFAEMFGWSEFVPQLTVDVINLNDTERRSYQQFTNATYSWFESGRTVLVGLRGRF